MAFIEKRLSCNLHTLSARLNSTLLTAGAELVHTSHFEMDGVQSMIRVYERFSFFGGNNTSLTLTFFGRDGDVHFTAVTAGARQNAFLHNKLSENALFSKVTETLEDLEVSARDTE